MLSWEEELNQNSIKLSTRDSTNQDLTDILSHFQESLEFFQRMLKSQPKEKANLMVESLQLLVASPMITDFLPFPKD